MRALGIGRDVATLKIASIVGKALISRKNTRLPPLLDEFVQLILLIQSPPGFVRNAQKIQSMARRRGRLNSIRAKDYKIKFYSYKCDLPI
jgi:hypothetical protein